jgi:AhpD family alkylhydroperoxidase
MNRTLVATATAGAVVFTSLLVLAGSTSSGAAPIPENAPQAVAAGPAPLSRAAIEAEITQMFGLVPVMFTLVPDDELELEWRLFKKVQFDPGPVPNKYRELIGLGISATTRCQYCIAYHTEVAKMFGATDAEIEATVHYAKSSAGWSAYLNGMEVDLAQFQREVRAATAYGKAQAAKAKKN